MNTLLFSFASGEKLPHNQNNQTDPPTRKADADQSPERQENEFRGCALLFLLRKAVVEVNVKKPDEFRQSAQQRVEMEMDDDGFDSEILNHRKDSFGETSRHFLQTFHCKINL